MRHKKVPKWSQVSLSGRQPLPAVLKREILGDRAFLLPGKNIVENAIAGERTMLVCGLRRLLAETRIVIGHERRKEGIRRRDRRNAREPQYLDQTVLQRAESPLHTALPTVSASIIRRSSGSAASLTPATRMAGPLHRAQATPMRLRSRVALRQPHRSVPILD
jgi:hypothetical protein